MNKFPAGFRRGVTYEEYARAVGEGECYSRTMMAVKMGVSYTTAQYHLERAVAEGLLNKAYGYIGRQPGWVYALPEDMPRLLD